MTETRKIVAHCTCINYGCDKCRARWPNGWLSKDFCCRCQLDETNPEDCPCVELHELDGKPFRAGASK